MSTPLFTIRELTLPGVTEATPEDAIQLLRERYQLLAQWTESTRKDIQGISSQMGCFSDLESACARYDFKIVHSGGNFCAARSYHCVAKKTVDGFCFRLDINRESKNFPIVASVEISTEHSGHVFFHSKRVASETTGNDDGAMLSDVLCEFASLPSQAKDIQKMVANLI